VPKQIKNAYDQVHLTCYITNTLTIDEIKQKNSLVIEEMQKKHEQTVRVALAKPIVKPSTGFLSKPLG
jgi:hypothetical protein